MFGNYSVEKNEKKVEAKPTMDTKSQETKLKTTKPQATKKPKTKKSQGKTETLQKGINSYWNMQGSGKVKFEARAGFYDEWGRLNRHQILRFPQKDLALVIFMCKKTG